MSQNAGLLDDAQLQTDLIMLTFKNGSEGADVFNVHTTCLDNFVHCNQIIVSRSTEISLIVGVCYILLNTSKVLVKYTKFSQFIHYCNKIYILSTYKFI